MRRRHVQAGVEHHLARRVVIKLDTPKGVKCEEKFHWVKSACDISNVTKQHRTDSAPGRSN